MQDNNRILFHYTNTQSAHNILRSLNLWASDARYLNDRQELTSSIEILATKLSHVRNLKTALSINNYSRNFCVFSLSASPKVLSQWRSYGDDGTGICIGFNASILCQVNSHLYSNMDLVDCIYDNHDLFIERLLEEEKESVTEISDMCQRFDIGQPLFDAMRNNPKPLDRIYTQLLRIKNPAFIEEQESRLVFCIDSKIVKTRISGRAIVPYIEHNYHDAAFQSELWCAAPQIWLGPKSDERNLDALRAFNQFGWGNMNIKDHRWGIFKYDCGYR